jgi:hypothetical protein
MLGTWAQRESIPVNAGAWYVVQDDEWALYQTGDEPGWPDGEALVAPVLFGRLVSPNVAWVDTEIAFIQVEFVEQSPVSLALSAKGVTPHPSGPKPSEAWSTAPLICPFQSHFEAERHTLQVEIVRERIGFGREDTETDYGQVPARRLDPAYMEVGRDQAAQVLNWFRLHGGGAAFWMPLNVAAARLEAPALPSDTSLQVGDTEGVFEGDWILLRQISSFVVARIVEVLPGLLVLEKQIGMHLDPQETFVSRLVLCRFDRPRLLLQWLDQEILSFRMPVTEVPQEYDPADDESLGESLGALPTKVYLYEFARDFLNGTKVYSRYTSFERDIEWGGFLWQAEPSISHGDIQRSLNVERDRVDVITAEFPANPLLDDATLRSEGTLGVVIRELQIK